MRTLRTAFVLFPALFTGSIVLAQRVDQLGDFRSDELGFGFHSGAIDDAGTVAYAVSEADPLGTNPRHAPQIFRWLLPSGAVQQITHFEDGTGLPSVSDNGSLLAFGSRSNPLGANHDESVELFVMASNGTGLTQLTDDPGPNGGNVVGVALAGSGNRIAFSGDIDPLGTNPTRANQVFVVDYDGTDMRQLARGDAPSISDDGQRIVFLSRENLTGANADGSAEVFVILADGTGLRQLSALGTASARTAMVSGNGSVVAFEVLTPPWPPGSAPIFAVNWDGSALLQVATGEQLTSIRDDGKFVFYTTQDTDTLELYSAFTATVLAPTKLTNTADPLQNLAPVVSGNGNRCLFRQSQSDYFSEYGGDLAVKDVAGAGPQFLTANAHELYKVAGAITADGTRVVYATYYYDVAYLYGDLWRIQADGTDPFLLLPEAGAGSISITGDGQTIVFSSYRDLTGDNSCETEQVFAIQADGTGLRQLTPPASCYHYTGAVVSPDDPDGCLVVMQRYSSDTEETRLFKVHCDGTGYGEIHSDGSDAVMVPRISDTGRWVAFETSANIAGGNPDGSLEVFRIGSEGDGLQQLTMDPLWHSYSPDISGDGDRVVYVSRADPLGTNPDHNREIFVYEVSTAIRRQLTMTTATTALGFNPSPRISRNGEWVYFRSTAPFFEAAPRPGAYRVSVDTGQIERVSALGGAVFAIPDRTGNRAVFSEDANVTGNNADWSSEIWLVDHEALARIYPGRDTPTLVSWDAEPKARLYDVIRGDVANLAPGPGGIDLGPVVCLEDDSPDTSISGQEDVDSPDPGRAFFYLLRGRQGTLDPGSWGTGTGGAARVPGPGGCS